MHATKLNPGAINANPGGHEWLVTNGIGGWASGTVAGILTRRYHGLLLAALQPPTGRTLLVAKTDATVIYDAHRYPLFANRWADDSVEPHGYQHLVHFYLDGGAPVWRYAVADALLEKRIWMEQGANTTYVQFRLLRGSLPLTLQIKVLANHRDYHGETAVDDMHMQVSPMAGGLRVDARDGAASVHLLADRGDWTPRHEWYRNFSLAVEQARGFPSLEDHLYAGLLEATLTVGESVTLVASTEQVPPVDSAASTTRRQRREEQLIAQTIPLWSQEEQASSAALRQLVLATDQFIVDRPSPDDPDGKTIIAGYPWFTGWGRDAMIALPGLTLVTGRPAIARQILRTFARHVDQGMFPNRFPDVGKTPEYNTVDATLWYFEAIRAHMEITDDVDLLHELFPTLADIIAWHRRGTRYHIHVDETDGLLYAGEPSVQLTWMDAKVGDWVVTPRIGKPVEVNALSQSAWVLPQNLTTAWHRAQAVGLYTTDQNWWATWPAWRRRAGVRDTWLPSSPRRNCGRCCGICWTRMSFSRPLAFDRCPKFTKPILTASMPAGKSSPSIISPPNLRAVSWAAIPTGAARFGFRSIT